MADGQYFQNLSVEEVVVVLAGCMVACSFRGMMVNLCLDTVVKCCFEHRGTNVGSLMDDVPSGSACMVDAHFAPVDTRCALDTGYCWCFRLDTGSFRLGMVDFGWLEACTS